MKLIVDGEAWPLTLPLEATVATALEEAIHRLSERRRWVVSAVLDGQRIPAQEPSLLRDRRCSECSTLEISSRPAVEVILPILDTLLGRLDQIRGLHQRAGEAIALAQGLSGLEALMDCMKAWKMFMGFLAQLDRLASVPAIGLKISREQLGEFARRLQAPLTELMQALEVQDLSLAGDVLSHDLIEQLRAWEELLRDIRSVAARDLAPPKPSQK